MSAEIISRQSIDLESEREREDIPVVSYEKYREFCDEAQPNVYRKTGIDSQENYEVAVLDPETVFIEKDGYKLPFFVSLQNAGGYNVEGTQELTRKRRLLALALPLEYLDQDELSRYLGELGEDVAVIVQTSSERTQEIKSELEEKVRGIGWSIGDFLDPRCPDKYKAARITIYSAQLSALDESGEVLPFQNRSLHDLFDEDRNKSNEADVELITAQAVRDNPQLFEQLWDLHNDRFDWLGEYHPVSMQETKAFFEHVVSDDHTTSFVRFDYNEDGERVPMCHGCFVDDLNLVEWINDRFRAEIVESMQENSERMQFFYGIASKSQKASAHYAKDIMQLHSRINQMNGGLVRLMFESTNKSSLYIPRMVGSYVSQEPNGITITEGIQPVSQLDYWYLAPESDEMV
jgi:hypothetical protein